MPQVSIPRDRAGGDYRLLQLMLEEVRFDDDTVWVMGKRYRIDPIDPRKWSLMDEVPNTKPKLPELSENEKLITLEPRQPRTKSIAVEITDISVAGRSVPLGRPFTADDDWLRSLILRVRNVSTKPIISIRVSLSLPEARYRYGGIAMSLRYGKQGRPLADSDDVKPLMPGEEIQLSFSDEQYEQERKFVEKSSGVTKISRVSLGTATAVFTDRSVGFGKFSTSAEQPREHNGAKRQ